jgi:hypothetical protein
LLLSAPEDVAAHAGSPAARVATGDHGLGVHQQHGWRLADLSVHDAWSSVPVAVSAE